MEGSDTAFNRLCNLYQRRKCPISCCKRRDSRLSLPAAEGFVANPFCDLKNPPIASNAGKYKRRECILHVRQPFLSSAIVMNTVDYFTFKIRKNRRNLNLVQNRNVIHTTFKSVEGKKNEFTFPITLITKSKIFLLSHCTCFSYEECTNSRY
jgi:hypothetical protein